VRDPRDRRYVSASYISRRRLLYRRSEGRQAWVLRGVGNRFGPVLVSLEEIAENPSHNPEAWEAFPTGPEQAVRPPQRGSAEAE
jgi:hypothetical protein